MALNLPTRITLVRLAAVPLILAGMGAPLWPDWVTLAIFVLAAGTDWLDGWLARRLNQVTDLGKFLDPLVDKLLVLAPLLMLVQQQIVPAWAVFVILARELAIAGWRVNQTTISGANSLGKLKTVTQIGAVILLLPPLAPTTTAAGLGLFWLAVALTVVSGAVYLRPQRG